MPHCLWICLNISEYARVCLNLPEWLFFTFPLFNTWSVWKLGYLFQRLNDTKSYSLEVHEVVFLKRQNLFFSRVVGSIWFILCVFDKISLQVRFQIYCYLWRLKEPGTLNLDKPSKKFFWSNHKLWLVLVLMTITSFIYRSLGSKSKQSL